MMDGVVFDGVHHRQLPNAMAFARGVIAEFPNANLIFTGHSLGGYLAQLVSLSHANSTTLAINSPGLGGYTGYHLEEIGIRENILYLYSEVWGVAGSLIHPLGTPVSGNVYYVQGASGHGLESIIDALSVYAGAPISLEVLRYEVAAAETAFNAILVAREYSGVSGLPLNLALAHVLANFAQNDGNLLGSPAFSRMLVNQLSGELTQGQMSHLIANVLELSGGAQCFPAGTLISMANSTQRRIEDIRAGDVVLSFDPATGAHVSGKVTKLYRGETDSWIVANYIQSGTPKTLAATPERPFLTKGGQFAPISQVTLAGERWAA